MAKRDKEKNKNEGNDFSFGRTSFISRIIGPVKVLIKLHLKVATHELKTDVKRYISGMINLFIGIFCIIISWIFINMLAVAFLKKILEEIYSILIVAGSNLFIAVIMFLSAVGSFKKPFLKETTKVIKDTINELK